MPMLMRRPAWILKDHGGGYAYRLAPGDGPLTEEEFRKTPLNFVGLSALRWDGDKAMQETFNTTELGTSRYRRSVWLSQLLTAVHIPIGWETDRGTIPEGSTWRKVPIPYVPHIHTVLPCRSFRCTNLVDPRARYFLIPI